MSYPLIIANIIMAGILLVQFYHLPPQIPLFYSRPWGESQLADWWFILILPILMNLLYFFNRYIGKKFFSHNEFALKIITYFNFFLLFTFTLIFVRIIFLIS